MIYKTPNAHDVIKGYEGEFLRDVSKQMREEYNIQYLHFNYFSKTLYFTKADKSCEVEYDIYIELAHTKEIMIQRLRIVIEKAIIENV